MSKGPLHGLRVVEFAGLGPCPCAGMMFADMGADVVLVERTATGADSTQPMADEHSAPYFFYNRGKRSITLDLKNPETVALALQLVERADILLEGFRPGVMERLGLGPEVCLERNAGLIYGRLTGWGQDGPLAQAAGHEPNYIGVSGALWHSARPDQAPVAPLTALGDFAGGSMMLAWGVMCALVERQRSGKGQVVDAAITDGSAYLSTLLWMMRGAGQLGDKPGLSWADGAAPWNNVYRCGDGKYVSVCALEPQFFQELLRRLELDEDSTLRDQWNRERWPEGRATLERLFASRSRSEWRELLEGTDACFAPVMNLTDAPNHPHNVARGTFTQLQGVTQPSPAPRLQNHQPTLDSPPVAGEQTDAILKELGLENDQIEQLRQQGSI